MAQTFPGADLYALTRNRSLELSLGDRPVSTTFLDGLGPLQESRAALLPLMPLAWRFASRKDYEVVITSSHACAKGFWPARNALHLCYCYTPMRYAWFSSIDRRSANPLIKFGEKALRSWDLESVGWVDEFAAISTVVKRRIEKLYSRPARLIFPPVDTDFFTPGRANSKKEFALSVSRMVPYKRLDLAIRACHAIGYSLIIAGAGPQEKSLRALSERLGADVEFVISPHDEALRELYRTALALVFPSDEDFGIVSVEAQACGTPVVALGRGGSMDTVVDGVTGVLVSKQSEDDFAAGLQRVLNGTLDTHECRRHAEGFSELRFQWELREWVLSAAAQRGIRLDQMT